MTTPTRPAFDLVRDYVLTSMLASLDQAGALDQLQYGVRAEDLGGETALAAATLRYLAERGVAAPAGDSYRLTRYGRAIYADKGYLVWLNGGYGTPLREFGEFVTGRLRYGTDGVRDGKWVAVGSAILGAADVVPEVMDLIEPVQFNHAVDLGCGNARFLLRLCQQAGAAGLGVDISPEAVEEAEKEIVAASMADRVSVVCADAAVPAAIPDLEHAQLVVTFFFLHEVLGKGFDALVSYLGGLAARLPANAHLVAAEVAPPVPGEPTAQPFSPEFTLIHALMRQTLLDSDGWRKAFDAGGFEVVRTVQPRMPGGLLVLARRAG